MRPQPEVSTFRHTVKDDVLDNCLAHWLRIIEEAYNEEE